MSSTILSDRGEFAFAGAPWLSAGDAERVTGWTLKPEGMCRDELCVPLPATLRRGDLVDVAAFWRHIGNPVVTDKIGAAMVLGAGAEQRNRSLEGLAAPDFALRDLSGMEHRLSGQRGKKVLLVTWASW